VRNVRHRWEVMMCSQSVVTLKTLFLSYVMIFLCNTPIDRFLSGKMVISYRIRWWLFIGTTAILQYHLQKFYLWIQIWKTSVFFSNWMWPDRVFIYFLLISISGRARGEERRMIVVRLAAMTMNAQCWIATGWLIFAFCQPPISHFIWLID
jgi:hypothetical protein